MKTIVKLIFIISLIQGVSSRIFGYCRDAKIIPDFINSEILNDTVYGETSQPYVHEFKDKCLNGYLLEYYCAGGERSFTAIPCGECSNGACAGGGECGDGRCTGNENPENCAQDCGNYKVVRCSTCADMDAAAAKGNSYVLLTKDIQFCPATCVQIRADNVILDGGGHTVIGGSNTIHSDNLPKNTNITIKNFKFIMGTTGMYIRRDSYVYIYNNVFEKKSSAAIHIENSFDNLGRFFEIHDNVIKDCGKGILVQDGSRNGKIYRNVIINSNQRTSGYGSEAAMWIDADFRDIDIYENYVKGGRGGIRLRGQVNRGTRVNLHHNTVVGCMESGIIIWYNTYDCNIFSNLVKVHPIAEAFRVNAKTGSATNNNTFSSNIIDACRTVYHLDGEPVFDNTIRGNRVVGPYSMYLQAEKNILDTKLEDEIDLNIAKVNVQSGATATVAQTLQVRVLLENTPVYGASVEVKDKAGSSIESGTTNKAGWFISSNPLLAYRFAGSN
ncbi:MAG: right-handed parallel beta-helix repeat-containing protein, partial [bacterium]